MKMFRKKILRKKKILINPKISQIISKRSLTIELTIKIKIRWTSLGKKSFVGIKKVLHEYDAREDKGCNERYQPKKILG